MPVFCPVCGTLMIKVGERMKCPRCGYVEGDDSNYGKDSVDKASYGNGLFPFRDVREGQREFLEDCREAVRNGRHLIAHAPTGIGKTAAALSAAMEDSLDSGRTTFFLTSKRSQHRIAVETARRMEGDIRLVDIISKQEMCPMEESRLPYPVFSKLCQEMVKKGRCEFFRKDNKKVVEAILSGPMSVEEMVNLAKKNGVCPHKAAVDAIEKANLVICDYSLIFTELNEKVFTKMKRSLSDINIIVDEAHNLPDRLRSDLRSFLNPDILQEARRDLKDDGLLAGIIRRIEQGLEEKLNEMGETEIEVGRDFFMDILDSALKGSLEQISVDEFQERLYERGTKEALDGREPMSLYLSQFIDVWSNESSSIVHIANGKEKWIRCSLLDPSLLSADIFNGVHSSVLMSGTLYPGEMYADLLGISEAVIKEYKSPYPPENRKVVVTDYLSTAYRRRNARMYQAYANHIVDAARFCPGNIAVFFPSYSMMESIMERMEVLEHDKEIIVERRSMSKREREQILGNLENARSMGGALLLGVQGGSLSEGVDYSGNLLSVVMVIGLAVAPPNAETEALRRYYDEKFGSGKGWDYVFVYPAVNKAMQAAGRAIRDKDDRALIVLMDERFAQDRYARFLPETMRPEKVEGIKNVCKEFYG